MSRRSGNIPPGDPRNPLVPDWPDLIDGPARAAERPARSRTPLIVGISVVVILLLAGGFVLYRVLSPPDLVPLRPPPPLDQVAGPAVPERGAYIGAWNKPERLDDKSRLGATAEFENGLGRKLDIVNVYRVWDEVFPTESDLAYADRGYHLMLSWAGTDLSDIVSGQYDAMITDRARALRAVGKPLFMRWRWEMDRPNLAGTGTAEEFVAAWKHIKGIFDSEHATNVGWVWCPTADGFAEGRAQRYFPGDAVVDWTCADAYPGPDWRPMKEVLNPFLVWAKDHPKPIMIGEFGVARDRHSDERADYLEEAEKAFRADPQIKAVCYFDSNPAGNALRRQYRLRDDPVAMYQFSRMAGSPYFNPSGQPIE